MTTTTTPERTTPERSVEASLQARPTASATVEQLALLPADDVPVQLRLSQRTRRLGLAGIAMARAILADQAARRQEVVEAEQVVPPRAA